MFSFQRLLLLFGLLCVVGAAVSGYCSLPSPPEEFVAVPPVLDFGKIEQGQSLHGEFELVNRFRQPVRIVSLSESCGCSETAVDEPRLAPGERTKLRATWKTGTRRGSSGVQVFVAFALPDDQVRQLTVTLKGEVIPDIAYDPAELVFREGVASKQILRLSPARMPKFVLREVYVSHRAFKAAADKKRNTVEVTFGPTKWRTGDDFNPSLTVVTDSPREPRMYIDLKIAR